MASRYIKRIITFQPTAMVGNKARMDRLGYISASGYYPSIIRMVGQLIECCRAIHSGLHIAVAGTEGRTRTSPEEITQELRWDYILYIL